jgi:HlyD family secretion protein
MAAKKSGGWWKWIIILVILGAGAGGGFWYYKYTHQQIPEYETVAVTRGDLTQTVTATGGLNPDLSVTVGSQVSGIINKLNVDYNSIVKSNQVIAEIDPSTYQAAVEQADADLANANANLELQQVETKRSAELFTNKLISGSDYDTALATLHEAQAMVKIKEAVLHTAKANLGYCVIRSPVDGIVISRSVELGQTVASSFSTPTLFQIANDLTKMQIDSSVAEADVGGIVEGQHVTFTVDTYPYRNFSGSVIQVRNQPTNANNVVTYDCVIGVTNADYKLKPGMTANLSFIIAERENILTVPNAALRFRPPETLMPANEGEKSGETNAPEQPAGNGAGGGGGGHGHGHHDGEGHGKSPGQRPVFHTVYLLTGAGKTARLKPVQIKTGISDGISTEVDSGLDEGDQVVISATLPGKGGGDAAGSVGRNGFPRRR